MPWLFLLALFLTNSSLPNMGIRFVEVAKEAGINHKTTFGDERRNRYLLETTGCGIAFVDYDGDGWLDIFQVNGTRLGGPPADDIPTNRLYRNNGDGTFEDTSAQAGIRKTGWGQSVCVGDYDNDGDEDIFVAYFGDNALYRNDGRAAPGNSLAPLAS